MTVYDPLRSMDGDFRLAPPAAEALDAGTVNTLFSLHLEAT
jgi:hypothetical protein